MYACCGTMGGGTTEVNIKSKYEHVLKEIVQGILAEAKKEGVGFKEYYPRYKQERETYPAPHVVANVLRLAPASSVCYQQTKGRYIRIEQTRYVWCNGKDKESTSTLNFHEKCLDGVVEWYLDIN